jgi:putative membrane protein
MLWGGFSRYLGNPLLWLKLLLFTAMLLMAWPARRALRGWLAAPGTPAAAAVQAQRRWLMWQAHLLVLLPLAGILLAKGYG